MEGTFHSHERGMEPVQFVKADEERPERDPHIQAFYESIRTGKKLPCDVTIGATAAPITGSPKMSTGAVVCSGYDAPLQVATGSASAIAGLSGYSRSSQPMHRGSPSQTSSSTYSDQLDGV